MIRIGCPHKFIVGRIHQIPDFLDLPCDLIDKLLRRYACGFGFVFDLLTVFIGSGLEENIVSQHSLIPGNAVGQNNFIGIADVRLARRVGYRRCNVIFFAHDNSSFLIIKKRP